LRLTGDETPSKQQLNKWKTQQTEAYQMVQDHCISVNRVDTGPTRCAYEHTTTTSTTPTEERRMESWKLDNMLYTSDRLSPLARWSTLEADSESCATGLPNAKCPSDHLPIACIFAIQPSSELDALKRQEVLARLQELSIRHQHTLNDTEIAMEAKHQDILKNLAATISSSSSSGGGTNPETVETNPPETEEDICTRPKKKKKKKELPPKEVMEVIKEKRALMKQVKKGQEREREQVVQQLGNLERLLIQEVYGVAWRQWVKNGS
jgi:hypothetical protein